MGFKDFFKERLGFGDKEIEIDSEPVIPDLIRDPEIKEPATRRSIFESKILRVLALTTGLNVLSHTIPEKPSLSPQSENYKQEHSELSKKLGKQFDAFLFEMETYKAQKERTSENIHTEVGDFEEADASSKDIKSYLEKGYPKEWLSNVRGVRLVPFELDVPAEYGLKDAGGKGSAKVIAYAEKRGELGGSSIVFSKEINNFFSAASHEMGHANDWLARTDLSDEYRINLLYNVVKRVESPDRFKSAYVESINNKDSGKQLMHKATEYFAEIVAEYLNNPKEAKTKLAPADLTLVEQHLKVSATNFNPEQAVIAREARGRIIKQGIIEKQILAVMDEEGLKNKKSVFEHIRSFAAVKQIVAEYGAAEYVEDDEQDVIMAEAFGHSNKQWLEVNKIFLESLEVIAGLAQDYQNPDTNVGRDIIKNLVTKYKEVLEKLNKKLGKFDIAEREKIKKFHIYLENVVREAKIAPFAVEIDQYYK